jgi:hypothetical protein
MEVEVGHEGKGVDVGSGARDDAANLQRRAAAIFDSPYRDVAGNDLRRVIERERESGLGCARVDDGQNCRSAGHDAGEFDFREHGHLFYFKS